jgi:hypothetical protein
MNPTSRNRSSLFPKRNHRRKSIVTILCDSGLKYQSKLFNPARLTAHDLNPNLPIESVLTLKKRSLVFTKPRWKWQIV